MVVYHTASDDETKGLDQGNRQWQRDAGRTGEAPAFASGPRASGVGVSTCGRSACGHFAKKEACGSRISVTIDNTCLLDGVVPEIIQR